MEENGRLGVDYPAAADRGRHRLRSGQAMRFRDSAKAAYGRLCPTFDRTRLTSADVIAPSMFTSSRKLLALTGMPT